MSNWDKCKKEHEYCLKDISPKRLYEEYYAKGIKCPICGKPMLQNDMEDE